MNTFDDINKIFSMQTIAVVGMSPKPERPSHYVSMYMKEQGYKIIPVNPGPVSYTHLTLPTKA